MKDGVAEVNVFCHASGAIDPLDDDLSGTSGACLQARAGALNQHTGLGDNRVADITFWRYMETNRTLSFGGECIHVECNVTCWCGPMSISGQIRSVVQH